MRELALAELAEREPHVRAVAALLVPSTAVTDFPAIASAYRDDVEAAGGRLLLGSAVTGIRTTAGEVVISTADGGELAAGLLVNCAGLFSDRIAALAGDEPAAHILPFRGEYYELVPERRELVRSLVYPVPDPRFPFLGVHLTRGIDGGVHAGPNAVLALRREGYQRWSSSPSELADLARFRGTWALAGRYWRTGLGEYARSLSRRAFVHALQRLVPEVQAGGSGAGCSRGTRSGGRPRRRPAGRFRHQRGATRCARAERSLTGGDGLAADRTPRRAIGAGPPLGGRDSLRWLIMRLLVTGGAGFIGANFVHHVAAVRARLGSRRAGRPDLCR